MKASSRPSFIAVTGAKIGWNENSNNGKTGKIFYCSALSHVTWEGWSQTSEAKWRRGDCPLTRIERVRVECESWGERERQVWVGFVIILDIQLKPQRGVMAVKWDQMVCGTGWWWQLAVQCPYISLRDWVITISIQGGFNPSVLDREGSKD